MLADWAGFVPVVIMLAVVTGGSLLLVAMSKLPHQTPPAATMQPRVSEVFGDIIAALQQRDTWLGLAFALVGGAAFKSLEVILGPFLVDRGYSTDEIGWFSAGPMIMLMIAGSLSGGWLADRLQRRLCVGVALTLVVSTVGALAIADILHEETHGPHILLLLAATAFGIGLFTASSYALFMDLTRPGIAATQFSAFMGATNGCESWSSYTIGRIVASSGYATGMLVMCAVSLAAIPLLIPLSMRRHQDRDAAADRDRHGTDRQTLEDVGRHR